MKRSKRFLLIATAAGLVGLSAMPANAFWGPFAWMSGPGWGGWGPWGGYPWYGYGYPYYGGWGHPYAYPYGLAHPWYAPVAVQPAATSDK